MLLLSEAQSISVGISSSFPFHLPYHLRENTTLAMSQRLHRQPKAGDIFFFFLFFFPQQFLHEMTEQLKYERDNFVILR